MKKKGFTLVELLVVIAIIAVLSIIIIPSVVKINKNVNQRLLNGKIEYIESAARLYASNNQEIFNGSDEVYIYVFELIESDYLTVDVGITDSKCPTSKRGSTNKGCIIDPTATSDETSSINLNYVVLRKQGAGYSATFLKTDEELLSGERAATLVDAVCTGYANGTLIGKASTSTGDTVGCGCDAKTGATDLLDEDGNSVEACIIAGDNPNNYLRYGDSKPNWRVLGVYKIDGELSAKIITNEPI